MPKRPAHEIRQERLENNRGYAATLARSTWEPPKPGPVKRRRTWKHYTPAGPVTIIRPDGSKTTERALRPQEYRRVVRDRPIEDSLRRAVKRRDRGACRYCGTAVAEHYEIDHVIPVRDGGITTMRNLVLACRECNQTKGGQLGWKPTPLRRHLERLAEQTTTDVEEQGISGEAANTSLGSTPPAPEPIDPVAQPA